MDTEIWRDVADYEGLYQVSNFGRVKSFVRYPSGRVLKPRFKNGYPFVSLHHDNKCESVYVHRLVAQAFVPNSGDKPCVNHLNGDRTDNHVNNLEWCTQAENIRHAYATGLMSHGETCYNAKLTNEQVVFIRENPDGLTCTELARLFGVALSTIGKIQRGERYKNAGGQIRKSKVRYTPDDVQDEIRRLYVYDSHEFGLNALAKKFGVSSQTILRIVHKT